jgi:hypothetical protein
MGIAHRATGRITREYVTLKRPSVSTERLDAQLPDNLMPPSTVSLHLRRAVAEMWPAMLRQQQCGFGYIWRMGVCWLSLHKKVS